MAGNHHRVIMTPTDGSESWPFVLNSLGNLAKAYPQEELALEAVAYGPKGIDQFLHNSNGAAKLQDLNTTGIQFLACGNTLKNRQITAEALLPFVRVVESGIAHLIRRQEEGWSYVKGGF